MKTNILAASLSDRTVRLIDGNTGTYLSMMDFEFISTQASFSLLGLVAVCVLDLTEMRFKLHASFFLGLHYDCLGSTERAKNYMKKAFIYSGRGLKSDDVLGTACDLTLLVIYNDCHFKMFVDMLPLLQMKHRNFFDNDEVDEEDDLELALHLFKRL